MLTPTVVGSLRLTVGDYEVSLFLYAFLLLVGLISFLPLVLLRKWYFYRRRIKVNIITAEYDPPAKLTPAEMQYLFGGVEQQRITAATIIHLVQRGVLHMRKVDSQKIIYAGPKEDPAAKSFEKMLIVQAEKQGGMHAEKLLENPIAFVDGDLDEQKKSSTISEYVHDSLRESGLVEAKNVNRFFLDSLKVSLWILFSVVWWPVLLFWFISVLEASSSDFSSFWTFLETGLIATAILIVPLTILALYIVKWRAKLIGRRWMSTPRLTSLWPQLMGYRHYVKLTEKDRLQFDSKQLKESSNKDILPYAVALGFVDNWRDIVS